MFEFDKVRSEPSTLLLDAISFASLRTVLVPCGKNAAATRAAASAARRISVFPVCTRPQSTASEQKLSIAIIVMMT
jgi:hypothetical protein